MTRRILAVAILGRTRVSAISGEDPFWLSDETLNYAQCMVRRRTARGLKLGEGTVRVNVSGL